MRHAIFAIFFLLLSIPGWARAQEGPPLVGPLIAVNAPAQDHITLYDLGARDESTRQRTLTLGTGWLRLWDFSPDGCRILYTLSDGTLPAKLFSARLDGSDARELARYDELPAESWGVWEPLWSPDGSRIVFTMIRDQTDRSGEVERETHIAWVEPDGGEPQFYSVTGREFTPQWSPDGQWLVYVSYDERAAGADIFSTAEPTLTPGPDQTPVPSVMLEEADLWVVSGDGATKYRLTTFPTGSVHDPRWSPDGDLISFVYSPSPSNDTFWMIAKQEGAIPTQLNYNWVLALDMTWLPDSTAILAAARGLQDVQTNRLWSIPLVGNADVDATPYPDEATSGALANADYPRFSPDGRWLALRSAYDLVVINVTSRTWDILDPAALGNTPPVWSPAGFRGEAACGG